MIMQPYAVAIAMRYLRARSRSAFISFISAVSMLGIAIAVAVLIIVMGVVNGFETELERRILSVSPDASLMRYPGGPLDDWPGLREGALAHGEVTAAAPFIEGQGMIAGDGLLGVNLRGIDVELEATVSTIHARLVAGDMASLATGWNIVVGRALAEELDLEIGDEAMLFLPVTRMTPAGSRQAHRRFTVTGIFDVGMREFDRGLVLVGFDKAAALYRTGGRATGIGLSVADRYNAGPIVDEVASALPGLFSWSDWTGRHRNVFRSIELTKPLLFIMLSLVIAVAAFNIVSTLIMVVREKRGDIAILRSMGALPQSILGIFVTQGALIGGIGMLGGLALGLLLVAYLGTIVDLIEAAFGVDLLSADVYLIGDLPAEARAGEVARVCGLAFALAVVATLYPAYRASRQPPAEALRHE